jgi:GntR family transcriptional regulator/MocR family aminotransferase
MRKKAQPLSSLPRADLEISIQLERRSGTALHLQLATQLRQAIASGRLQAGSRIPSSRQLAATLGIDRNLVVVAYDMLLSEGYLLGKLGSGTFVTHERIMASAEVKPERGGPHRWVRTQPEESSPSPQPSIAFELGRPSLAELDQGAWRGIWRQVGATALSGGYGDPQGYLELRGALAQYLGRSRGLRCSPADILITSGCIQAAQLVARATLGPRDSIAFEEPGYPLVRSAFESLAPILPIPVDGDGLRVDHLPTGKAAPLLVYCTPSHQYPLGSRLSIPRRLALLEWARTHDCLIVEDDYDGEFRFETAPLPALAALGRDCTVYLGTFSKTIAPSLRVGYVVAPSALLDSLIELKAQSDYHTSLPTQMALARFIEGGHFERHIRRMRRVYAAKRQALLEALEPVQHLAPLSGLEAGLHAHLELPPSISAAEAAQQAHMLGIGVSTLEPYFRGPVRTNGLLLGYGGLSEQEIRAGGRKLVRVLLGRG